MDDIVKEYRDSMPDGVMRLWAIDAIDEIARLRAEVEVLRKSLYDEQERSTHLYDEIALLRVERDSMVMDSRRYQWLKSATKAEYLMARGAFGLEDVAIDVAIKEQAE